METRAVIEGARRALAEIKKRPGVQIDAVYIKWLFEAVEALAVAVDRIESGARKDAGVRD